MKIIPIASSICSGRGFHHKEKLGFILENWVFNGGRQFSISERGMWTFVMFTKGIIGYKQLKNSSINIEHFFYPSWLIWQLLFVLLEISISIFSWSISVHPLKPSLGVIFSEILPMNITLDLCDCLPLRF